MHAGAVLVFLPSWQSIVDVYNDLAAKPGVFERCIIHVLHSSLPMSEQQTVFDHAPPGRHMRITEPVVLTLLIQVGHALQAADMGISHGLHEDMMLCPVCEYRLSMWS